MPLLEGLAEVVAGPHSRCRSLATTSRLVFLAQPCRVPGDNFYRYEATVTENPIITKALTSCVAYGLGDLTAQFFTVSETGLCRWWRETSGVESTPASQEEAWEGACIVTDSSDGGLEEARAGTVVSTIGDSDGHDDGVVGWRGKLKHGKPKVLTPLSAVSGTCAARNSIPRSSKLSVPSGHAHGSMPCCRLQDA